jgi:LAO/AO transport system kinase
VADMLAINKADGDNRARARRAQASYQSALRLMRGDSMPPVVTCSALEKTGLSYGRWSPRAVVTWKRPANSSGSVRRSRFNGCGTWSRTGFAERCGATQSCPR